MAWLALAARRAAATTARRAPPLLLDSTASSAARRATLQPAPPVRDHHLLAGKAKQQPLALIDAAATDVLAGKAKQQPLALLDPAATDLLAGKAKQPLALLDAAATDLAGKAKQQPLALLDADPTHLLGRAPLLAATAKQPLALLDAAATDTHLLGRAHLLAATAKQPPALLDAPASSSVVKAIADVRQAPIAKTGGFLFDLYGPRRASRGILFSAMNSGNVRTLARRGISTKASLTPEVKSALQKMEGASLARHQSLMREIHDFEVEVLTKFSSGKLASAETALTAGKAAWRVSSLVLLFGTTTLLTVLQLVKPGWDLDFQKELSVQLNEMVATLKADLLDQLRKHARKEILLVEARNALAARK